MGKPDQLLKYMFEIEAPKATHAAATFKSAPEIATSELTPDGLLTTTAPSALQALPHPWPLLEREAVLDGKMPGDHLDPLALERCLFRRHARQVQRIEKEFAKPRPSHCAAWVIAPHNPAWFAEWEKEGLLRLEAVAPGVTLVQPSLYPIVWVAANELPLHEALIPFLLARRGRKLKEFVAWVVHVRPPEWLAKVVQSHPEVAAMLPEFKPNLSPEDKLRIVEGLRKSVVAYPEAVEDLIVESRNEGRRQERLAQLVRLCVRQLRRPLTENEQYTLAARLDREDADHLVDFVLDLAPERLAAWLADPAAS